MTPRTQEIIIQRAVIIVLLVLVYIAFTNQAHASPEIYAKVLGV